jgi:hypothetical protein
MPSTLLLPDRATAQDLATFLARAARLDPGGAVRLQAGGGVLAVSAAVVHPQGLLDRSPTVLGLRSLALVDGAVDAVVAIAELASALQGAMGAGDAPAEPGAPVELRVPDPVRSVVWAAITPPRSGWQRMAPLEPAPLAAAARAGIEEVAAAVPGALGADLVHRVRREVWGRALPGHDHIPAGAAFALESLGFLGDDPVQQFASGAWLRFSTRRGHVLVKQVVGAP